MHSTLEYTESPSNGSQNTFFTSKNNPAYESNDNIPSEDSNKKSNSDLMSTDGLGDNIESYDEPKASSSKYKSKPDYCYFCEDEVQNFARHIQRNHSYETEVARIMFQNARRERTS